MKKSIVSVAIIFVVLITSSPVLSQGLKFGVGASATSSSSTVYFPIKSSLFIIEPMIRYRWAEQEQKGSSLSQEMEMDLISIGSGFFLYKGIYEKVDFIYGARLGYMESKEEGKAVDGSNVRTSEEDLSGYFVAPTVGIEYSFNDHISVGCNVSIEYQRLTGEEKITIVTEEKFDTKFADYSTHTDLFVKYYF